MSLHWFLRVPAFIIIIVIAFAFQYVDGRVLLSAANQVSRRETQTCKPLEIIPQDPVPRDPSQQPIGDADVDEDDDLQSSSSVATNATRPRRRSLASSGPNSRQELISGGRRLWQELQDRLHNPTGDALTLCIDFDKRWDAYRGESYPAALWRQLLPQLDWNIEEWSSILVVPKGRPSEYDPYDIHYENYFAPRQEAIIAIDNRGQGFNNNTKQIEELATDHWSTAVALAWIAACETINKPASDLKYILRDNIANAVTQDAVSEVFGAIPYRNLQDGNKFREMVLTPNSGDSFFMMLRTPNLVGVMHMLSDFVNTLGRKSIKEIGLAERTRGSDPLPFVWIWVTLEVDVWPESDTEAPGSVGSSTSDTTSQGSTAQIAKDLGTVEVS